MLDRSKIAQEIASLSHHLFKQHRFTPWMTPEIWRIMVQDEQFLRNVYRARSEQYLAMWRGALGDVITIPPISHDYSVLAVDGSQIYPDHHMGGIDCFLVNVAGCLLTYGAPSKATFFSYPHLYVPQIIEEQLPGVQFSTDLVDLLREDQEFALLVERSLDFFKNPARPEACRRVEAFEREKSSFEKNLLNFDQQNLLALFDGNLLFWHLENKGRAIKEIFLKRYLAHLDVLYERRILHAGYLSQSQFRDICLLFQAGLATIKSYEQQHAMLAYMTDADLLAQILVPGQRTTVLYSSSSIVELYPPYLVPCFFYLHAGSEIVRIEIPLWIGNDDALVNQVAAICFDQSLKGNGYPVALAESHAQAVVKSADRDFFYNMIQKHAVGLRQRVTLSPKNLKKKAMNI